MQTFQRFHNKHPQFIPNQQPNRPIIQRDLNRPTEPQDFRFNPNNNFYKKKKPHFIKPNVDLSLEEGEILLQFWRQTNFNEFNSWVQVAKAQINTEVFENTNDINRKSKKVFTCNLALTFADDPDTSLISNGFAENKKDAKKNAIEKIVIQLIQTGEIRRGLKNKDFLQEATKQLEQTSQSFSSNGYYEEENSKKMVQRLARKMQDCLRKDAFLDACEILCQILSKKKPEWNDICFIWSYALLKKNFSYIKSIIDIIQFKRVQTTLNPTGFEESKTLEGAQDEKEEKAKKELLKKYGNCRMKSDNPYDLLDIFNMEVNLPEIDSREGRVITDEEACAEILKDPMNIDLSRLFVLDSNNSFLSSFGNLPTDSFSSATKNNKSDPRATFASPKLSNAISAVEINKLLHQLSYKAFPDSKKNGPKGFGPNANSERGNAMEGQNESESKTMSGWPQHLSKEADIFASTSGGPPIDLNTSKEIKDPSVNYLSYKLLNEFYDSLLYVSDLGFALSIAEILYTRIKVDDEDFINNFACLYYANKKNMMMIELIECIFQPITRSKSKLNENVTNIDGTVEKIGNKFSQEVIIFSPIESEDQLHGKLQRKGGSESRENHVQIAEGEFVLLSCTPQISFNLQQQQQQQQLQLQSMMGGNLQSFNFGFDMSSLFGNNNNNNNQNNMMAQANSNEENLGTNKMIACVREISRDGKIKLIVLPTKEQGELLAQKDKVWNIMKLTNRTSSDKTCEALETFSTKVTMAPQLLQVLLSPPIGNNTNVQSLAEGKVFQRNDSKKLEGTNLNASQERARIAATTQRLTLIQGPPGTGKTTTAVEIVIEWLRTNNRTPILACADSNVAVDLLYREFMQAGIYAIRVGGNFEDRAEFKADRNYLSFTSHQSQKNYTMANNVKYGIIKRIIGEAQVICATCVGTTSEYLKPINFPRVIMDEVTQANELSTLIPLIKGCQQLVLIGDHKQLPPTVISTFAQSKGMTISLFERLVKQGVQPHLLDIQYRMHPSIAEFPSQKFYNKLLQNGVDPIERPLVPGFDWPNKTVQVAFVNVKGVEQIYSSSIQNTREVEVVVEILIQLLNNNPSDTIGVITPYDAQRKRLRNEVNIQARKYPHLFGLTQEQVNLLYRNVNLIDIDTVDGYQGMEREVIIFSAVRSNRSGSLGFLKDPRRLNVTLTRAKRGLIIVGNMETLVYDPNWKDWIQWCRNNRVILHSQ